VLSACAIRRVASPISGASRKSIQEGAVSNPNQETWPPGTEFLDAETGRQNWCTNATTARRDQNPRNERPEIPAETPYLASCRNRAVCEDWVVVCAVICKPVSMATSRLLGKLIGNFGSLIHLEARALANSPDHRTAYGRIAVSAETGIIAI
jgi:hypothetical protein